MKYVIDAYAWIEYFIESEKGRKVRDIIESQQNEIFTSIITFTEVNSIIAREKKDPGLGNKAMLSLSNIYPINLEMAKETGILHAETRKKIKDFGLADTFVLVTARRVGAKILTRDPHFKTFKEVVLI